jgi:hypothetical protein
VRFRALAVVAFALVGGGAACATVWGFEDATERGADGGASSSSSGSDGAPVATGEVTPSDVPGIMCAPAAPEGWQGPLAIFTGRGTPLPAVPGCPDRYDVALEGKADPIAPKGACTCTCEIAGMPACAGPLATFYSDDACSTACGTPDQVVPTRNGAMGCTAFVNGNCPASRWIKLTDAKPAGSCAPKKDGLPAPPSWAAELRLCAPKVDVSATCPAGAAPAPVTAFPYEPNNFCIAKRSAGACPSTYPRRREFFDETQVNDSRGCKDCTCGTMTGPCGGVVNTVDTPGNCSGGGFTHLVPTACSAVKSSNTGFGYDRKDGGGPFACPPSGGGPDDGAFEAKSPITVCCRVE